MNPPSVDRAFHKFARSSPVANSESLKEGPLKPSASILTHVLCLTGGTETLKCHLNLPLGCSLHTSLSGMRRNKAVMIPS